MKLEKDFPFPMNKVLLLVRSVKIVLVLFIYLFINLINIIMNKTFKDFDSEGRFKGVYLSKYLTDEEKTKVKRFAKLDK